MSSIRTPTRPGLMVALLVLTVLVSCQTSPGTPVNQPPTASFLATGAVGPAPLTVGFDASASFDPDGTINAYLWNFGDGATGTGVITQHTYTAAGGYTARLTVIDDRGGTASASVEIEVGSGSGTGSVSGRITVGGSVTTTDRQALPRRVESSATADGVNDAWATADGADVVPGELIVKFAPGLRAQGVLAPMTVGGVRLDAVRALALPGAQLYRAPGLSQAATIALARQVQARPDVVYAQPNAILHAFAIPNDEFYEFQWHYDAINMPAAWDITTGSPGIVVAVLDTGILYRPGDASSTHPDLVGKVLPGYDFISDPISARDDDGRDPDPFDEGFDACVSFNQERRCIQYGSSYHGSHVAGTIAAATNNGVGVAGVDWEAMILPIRVLGRGGGSMTDIMDGTLWAAGFEVDGVPSNANPAHVINLSLGAQTVCGRYEQEVFDQIASTAPRRAIVVVAAGNDNTLASGFMPANCSNVITVGATGPTGTRAPYSNYGSRIDVMAPGGDTGIERGGVLSLFYDDDRAAFGYLFSQGTSMAAPHVAGVISLMKALQPTLGLSEALALLQATARPLSAAACGTGSAGDCGAGLIDAAAALALLQSGNIPNPGGGALVISPNPLEFGSSANELAISLTNTTSSAVSWALLGYVASAENPGALLEDSVYIPTGASLNGFVAAGGTAQTLLGVDRTKVTADGAYQFELVFDVDGTEQSLVVRFRVGAATIPDPEGPMIVVAFVIDDDGDLVLSGLQESGSFFSDYGFEVEPGDNLVIAWSDVNGNDDIDTGDYIGIYRDVVPVGAGQNVTGLDFAIDRVLAIGSAVTFPGRELLRPDEWQRVVDGLLENR